jgi:hypothetical protein
MMTRALRLRPSFATLAVAIALVFRFAPSASAQLTQFSVSSPTGINFYTYTWTPLTVAGSGGYLLDPTADQQTGQFEDDFVSSASTPGFFMRYGNIPGVGAANEEAIAFRMVMNKAYYDNKGNPVFGGLASIGLDSNNDGTIDIVFTVVGKNQDKGINYQLPGTGANVSPSTTTLGSNVLLSTFNSSNFDYRLADNTIYPGWTQVTTDPDAVITFALSFTNINTALAAAGKAPITSSTLLRFIAFTSTQGNSINQDVYGSNGISGAVRFDAPGGGFTELTDATGRPIPEPATWLSLTALLGAGYGLKRLRESRAAGRRHTSAPTAPVS